MKAEKSAANMTRKPKRSVAVAGAPPPVSVLVGVGVKDDEVGVPESKEGDGDDMGGLDPSPVESW